MNLNSAQKEAAEHDKGPLLIIAGAGTGKTSVITSRISELISSKKAKSDEILAITFTKKAMSEMVDRVDESMPLGYEDMCIKTFHSFCEGVLQESGMEIGIDPDFKLFAEVDQWFFFKKNLFSFNLDYYRPLGAPNKFIVELLKHFGRLKDELIEAEDYVKYADGLDGEDKVKTAEIARVYGEYGDMMVKNNYMDFAGLIYWTIRLFEKRKSVLEKYQKRFKYILVDEFQDTNYAQYKLLKLLAGDEGNIVVVGDDDQSIYKWRGASLSNILKFEEEYKDHKKVVLVENYRNSSSILDGAYSLIQNNNPDRLEVRAGIDKKLRCNQKEGGEIEIHHFPNFIVESTFAGEKIKELHENGVDFKDIAILVRNHKHALSFIDELRYLGIPYQVKNPKGLLAINEIKDLVSLAHFLSDPTDNVALLRIIKMEVFGIEMNIILNLIKKSKKADLFGLLNKESDKRLTNIFEILEDLIGFSKKNSVGAVINEFMEKTGYLKYLMTNDFFEEVENINQFARQVMYFERENEDRSVLDFADFIDLLEQSDSPLPYEDFLERDSVQILSAHGAKGLEFDYVFIVSVVKERFPGRKWSETFEIPVELTREVFPEGDFKIQEERRLFYVAMTRARKGLFVSYSDKYEGDKNWKMSPFVQEVIDSGKAVITNHEETADAVEKLKTFKESAKPKLKLPPFNKKKISYSQVNTFEKCPLQYNFQYLLKVPAPPSHATSFGNSVHKTLNDFYQMLKDGEKVDFDVMKELYEKNWISLGYENATHKKTRKKRGEEILKQFYDDNSDPWVVPAHLERAFTLKVEDFMIKGRIDRIDRLSDGTYEVIDYKTGRIKSDFDIEKDLQMSVYALACRDVFGLDVSKYSVYFLEEGKKITGSRTEDKLEKEEKKLIKLYAKMKDSDFPAKPSVICNYCNYRPICPAV
ncbi:MAG: ATP-dependent DNA helicase [Candidatus Peregrinibacteria bacterium]